MPRFTFVEVPVSKTSKQMEILLAKGKIRFRDRLYNLSDYRDKYDSMDEGDFYDFMEKIYEEDRAMSEDFFRSPAAPIDFSCRLARHL